MIWRTLILIATMLGAMAAAKARADDCPGNPNALGTKRVITVDPREYPRIGTAQYSQSLPLDDKEVVLTFDDGPMPPYTSRVLDVLAEHCVKANYFLVGRMARGYPHRLGWSGVGQSHGRPCVLPHPRVPAPPGGRSLSAVAPLDDLERRRCRRRLA